MLDQWCFDQFVKDSILAVAHENIWTENLYGYACYVKCFETLTTWDNFMLRVYLLDDTVNT